MNTGKTCIVGLSGGVDSAVSAFLMKERGYNVIAYTLKLFKTDNIDPKKAEEFSSRIKDAAYVADFLKIQWDVFDCSEAFEKYVIDSFVNYYRNGKTPCPCVICNEHIKFKYLNELRKKRDADLLVTGHYAKIVRKNLENSEQEYYVELYQGVSKKRDQSYFLYALDHDALMHAEFPLGDFEKKSDTRDIARKIGIKVAEKSDSQDICFIPDGDYIGFVRERLRAFSDSDPAFTPAAERSSNFRDNINQAPNLAAASDFVEGNIVDLSGKVLGKHNGIINYTIGQRKGLGLSGGPFFVNRIDAARNEVIVSSRAGIKINKLFLKNVKFLNNPFYGKCYVKIRSCGAMVAARVERPFSENGNIEVTLLEPEYGAAAGQHCVFYENNSDKTKADSATDAISSTNAKPMKILGGGEIESWT